MCGSESILEGVDCCCLFQADLAVHKKKVTEVQQWLEFALSSVSCRTQHYFYVPLERAVILQKSLSKLATVLPLACWRKLVL